MDCRVAPLLAMTRLMFPSSLRAQRSNPEAAQAALAHLLHLPSVPGLLRSARNDDEAYIRSNFFALPLSSFTLSSREICKFSTQSIAGLLATNGQSMANMMRSMPISVIVHISAG